MNVNEILDDAYKSAEDASVAKCERDRFAHECTLLSRWIRHDAPKYIKEIALGWTEDDERETP